MTRWLLRAVVLAAGYGGVSAAQTPPPAALANTATRPAAVGPSAEPAADWPAVRAAAPDAPPDEMTVLLMRTTGQPERRLKVLKRSTYSDGESLVDVQDLTSGQKFTLPGKLADRLPKEGRAPLTPAPTIATQTPPPAPFTPAPAVATLPLVQPQSVPQSPPQTVPSATRPGETVWRPAPSIQSTAPPPGTVARPQQPAFVPIGSAALPPAGATPPPAVAPATPTPTGDRWKPIPAPVPTPSPYPNPPGPLSFNGREDVVVARGQMFPQFPAQSATVTLPRIPERVVPKTSFTAPPSPLTTSLTAPPDKVPDVRPNWPKPTGQAPPVAPAVEPPRSQKPKAEEPKLAIRPSPERFPIVPTELPPAPAPNPAPVPEPSHQRVGTIRLTSPADPEPAPPVTLPVQYRQPAATARGGWSADDTWLAEIVRREMQPMADLLATALRPSVRVNAALGLADMRYAARPEVKAVLAKAAVTDPAVLVRTVCVRALAALGYNDPAYVEYLRRTAGGDAPEQLRMAAAYALRAVTPRD